MLIDNSAANEFRTCPLLYFENRIAEGTGLEPKSQINEVTPLGLGSRIHELLEEHYQNGRPGLNKVALYPPSPNDALENEADIIMSAYKAKYPVEEFEIVDVERTFKVQLPELCPRCYSKDTREDRLFMVQDVDTYSCKSCIHSWKPRRHIYTGKIDVVFRETGYVMYHPKLSIMDHKSEKRRSNSNHPKKWAATDQASLYLWAASRIYPGEEIGNFYVNILKRPSDKLQEGPIFPDRQRLERTQEQIDIAVRDIVFIADEIERYKSIFGKGLWPANRQACSINGWDCSFYLPHTYGWSEEIRQQKFQAKTPYLKLGDVDIIQ